MTAVLEPPTPGPAGPTGPQGPAGPEGPEGPAGSVGTYLHTQNTPASSWDVVHNLGFYPGGVLVTDSAGTEVVGEVTQITTSRLRIDFAVPFGGTAAVS